MPLPPPTECPQTSGLCWGVGRWYLRVAVICLSLITSEVKQLFVCLEDICVAFFCGLSISCALLIFFQSISNTSYISKFSPLSLMWVLFSPTLPFVSDLACGIFACRFCTCVYLYFYGFGKGFPLLRTSLLFFPSTLIVSYIHLNFWSFWN